MPRSQSKPPCMVPTCKKDPQKFPSEKFYKLPPKGDLRDLWLRAVRVDGSHISATSAHFRVCQDHFTSSDFERDFKSELLGLQRHPKLKSDAVPSLFLPSEEEEDVALLKSEVELKESDVENELVVRTRRSKRKPVTLKQKNPLPQYGCLLCSTVISKRNNYCSKFNHPGASNIHSLNKLLWNIFVLKNVLNLAPSNFLHLLEKFGRIQNPDAWFDLCSKCSSDIAQAMSLNQDLLRIQLEIESIYERLRKKVEATVELEKDPKLRRSEVEMELWGIIKERKKADHPPVVDVKMEQMDCNFWDEDIDFRSHANSPPPSVTVQRSMELAARIDQLLKQNEAIVGEPLSRPEGFESDSGSVDELSKNKRKRKSPLIRKQPPLKQQKHGNVVIKATPKVFVPRILAKAGLPKFIKIKCTSCPAIFCTKELFRKHNEAHERSKQNGNKFECQLCGLPVLNEQLLKQHVEIRHNNDKDSGGDKEAENDNKDSTGCKEEEDSTQTITSTSSSTCSVFLSSFKFDECPFCPARYNNLLHLENHLALHERNADFGLELDCPYPKCSVPFENYAGLVNHLKKSHEENIMNICDICGFTISKARNKIWNSHLRKHRLEEFKMSESSQFGCTLCDQEFDNKKALIRHRKKFHAEELGVDSFLCTECPRKFTTKWWLDHHFLRFHSGGDSNIQVCEVCGQGLPTKHFLKLHMKKHESQTHICDRCGGVFNSLTNLREHKKNFYGETLEGATQLKHPTPSETIPERKPRCPKTSKKPHRCRHCGITLPHLSALRRHVRSHCTFQCKICGNKFMTTDCLQKHNLAVHSCGPMTMVNCKYCGKEFKHRINVYSHYMYCKEAKKSRSLEANEKKAKGEGLECSKCKRSFQNKQALGGHVPNCKIYYSDEEEVVKVEGQR